jgi:hypothetical protein
MTDDTPEVEETEEEKPFGEQELQPETDSEEEQDTFDRDYVEKLRNEAAEHRTSRKDAEERLGRVQAAYRDVAVSNAVAGVLVDASDLAWSDDFLDDDGLVDAEKVQQAATALLENKPHLGRVRGDVGQGFKARTEEVSLAAMLRN